MTARTPVRDGWLGVDAVRDARERTRDLVRHTPVLTSRSLSDECGGTVLLKAENLQRTGSFKLRGALAKVDRIDPAAGVVAGSAGNHAQSLAYAARARGMACEVFMPAEASVCKAAAVRGFGGTVRLGGDSVDACVARARERAEETGAVFVHPFDDAEIVAGQGTLGLELLEDVPDLATIVVPVGGGGLISGIAGVVKAARPGVRIIGVQAEACAAYPASLAGGAPVEAVGAPDDRRRHRHQAAGRADAAARRRMGRRVRHRGRGRRRRRDGACCSSARSSWSRAPARSASRRCGPARSRPRRRGRDRRRALRRQRRRGRARGRRAAPRDRAGPADAAVHARRTTGRAGWRGCSSGSPTPAATSSRSTTCARRSRSTCARRASTSCSRRAARSTPPTIVAQLEAAGYEVERFDGSGRLEPHA